MILILEDSSDRIAAFRRAIERIDPDLKVIVWKDARRMIREVGEFLHACRVISLDHDLYALDDMPDPGDGLEMAKFLVAQPIVRNVIVHSSNGDRAQCMLGEFELAGWPCARVVPFGDGWVERDWVQEVKMAIGQGRG